MHPNEPKILLITFYYSTKQFLHKIFQQNYGALNAFCLSRSLQQKVVQVRPLIFIVLHQKGFVKITKQFPSLSALVFLYVLE